MKGLWNTSGQSINTIIQKHKQKYFCIILLFSGASLQIFLSKQYNYTGTKKLKSHKPFGPSGLESSNFLRSDMLQSVPAHVLLQMHVASLLHT